jgi:SPFH domain / Band 7 family
MTKEQNGPFVLSMFLKEKTVSVNKLIRYRLSNVSSDFYMHISNSLVTCISTNRLGPGLFFILPCVDTYSKVDLRTVTFDVPPQEILTKDSVTVAVDAVVYFRIFNAVISITNVEDAAKSTKLLAATTLRNVNTCTSKASC